jgi:hypothetical protein
VTPDRIFSLANTVALLSWILLIVAGRKKWVTTVVTGFAVPLILAVLYGALVIQHWSEGPAGGGFSTLAGVSLLFSNPWKLLAGWVHYLAFDLFTGTWEVRDAAEKGVPHLLVIPSLALTFLFGPMGLLLYFLTRMAVTRSAGLQPGRAAQL